MMTPSLLAGALALTAVALPAAVSGPAAQPQDAEALSRRADAALGLTGSVLGDVRVTSQHDPVFAEFEAFGAAMRMELEPRSVRSEHFSARAQIEDGSWIDLPPEPVRTYRGSVLGSPGSRVAASLLDDGLHARIVLAGGEELWIEPLAPRLPGVPASRHALYRTEDVLCMGGTCDADLVSPGAGNRHAAGIQPEGGAIAGTVVTAELGCDADFEYYSAHGAGTQARIESVVNAINLQYASQVGITHAISTLLIRTSSNDPYTRSKADQLLNEFRNEWNTNQSGVQRDVAHLFTGRDLAGNTIGIAYIATVCNLGLAYSVVQSDFAGTSSFACTTDLSAHELGHTWGADHCSCPGFTMNPSITCANTFHPTATIPEIVAYRNAQSCFGAPPTTGTVSGTVTSSAGGSPIAGAIVQVDSGQSDMTAGNGSYSIAGVPTGSRTVMASAPGFMAASQGATVSDGQTTTVDFSLDPAPSGSQAIVNCITYSSSGGANGDRHLFIEVAVVDDTGSPVPGATVSVSVDLNGSPFGTGTATTDGSGTVTFQAKNSPNGCYETDVTSLSAPGLSFDGTEPSNGFAKGSDSSPDADCRSGSDACGAG